MNELWKERVLSIKSEEFDQLAIEIFKWQAFDNPLYHQYIKALNKDPLTVESINQIPFLPIEFFKNFDVTTRPLDRPPITFHSSGTTGENTSKHHVYDKEWYVNNAINLFEKQFGPIEEYQILALLPSYLERSNSSLVFMMESFIEKALPGSGFYLDNFKELNQKLKSNEKTKKLFFGVTFALLDFASKYPQKLSNTVIMDTGGMKGRGKEIIRDEVVEILSSSFKTSQVYSEYGMTELLSQAYTNEKGILVQNNRLKIFLRQTDDPFDMKPSLKRGAINIIDLANIDTCCFIETKDLGEKVGEGFKILGRFDHSDIRGCNLLYV